MGPYLLAKEVNMFDPNSLVGKEVRALDDEDYGHRVLIYYPDIQKYVVETIYWNNGKARIRLYRRVITRHFN